MHYVKQMHGIRGPHHHIRPAEEAAALSEEKWRMQFLEINRNSLGIIAVIISAAAIFMIVVLLLDQPAVADESAAAPAIMPQQQLDEAFQDFADHVALDRRLQRLEQQSKTLSNTAPTIVS